MEEKKLDLNTIIGFLLIGAILLYMLWQQHVKHFETHGIEIPD